MTMEQIINHIDAICDQLEKRELTRKDLKTILIQLMWTVIEDYEDNRE